MALILYSHCFSLCNFFTICSNYIFIFNLVYSCFWVLSSFSHTEFSGVLFHLDFLAFAATSSLGELCPFPCLLSSTSPWPSFCAVFPKLLHEGSFSHFIKATASLKFHLLIHGHIFGPDCHLPPWQELLAECSLLPVCFPIFIPFGVGLSVQRSEASSFFISCLVFPEWATYKRKQIRMRNRAVCLARGIFSHPRVWYAWDILTFTSP